MAKDDALGLAEAGAAGGRLALRAPVAVPQSTQKKKKKRKRGN